MAAVFGDDLLDQRQAQAGAPWFGGEERREYLLELFLGHAFAGVRHARRTCPPSRQVPTVNSPPSGMASQAVADQVQDRLPQLFGVGVDGGHRRIEMGAQVHVGRSNSP